VEKYCAAGGATNDNIIRRMEAACWLPKATNTHLEYVILTAFILQQWLQERTSKLRYTYIVILLVFAVYVV
jgi:hypothetical protein